MTSLSHLPLSGVTVLELSQIMAGPTCGLLLADLGADVIKVERYPNGDDARNYNTKAPATTSGPNLLAGLPPTFMMLNRGKRSIALDLKHPDGQATLKRMVAKSDVLTENFRPGTLNKLGLGYEVLRDVNPALIYCSISGYGRTGPLADRGGFDLILQAFAGLISVTGEPGRPPVKPGTSIADINAGILAALGVLAAYIHRLKTGQGQLVETSLLQAATQQLYWLAAAYFSTGISGQPLGTAHPVIAPYQTYECADGSLAIGGANEANWKRISEVLGHAEWQTDPRFMGGGERLKHRADLEALITPILRTQPRAYWQAKFDEIGIPAGPVQTVGEALEHPQTRAVGRVIDADDPRGGSRPALGLPLHLGGTSTPATGAPPRVGQQTTAVLKQFGFEQAEIDALVASGAVHQTA